jgi:serine/threonine protein kinase
VTAYDERFGPYIVHDRIGTGGMAIVHHATLELEDGDSCEVALKRLLPQLADDRRLVDDFIREARLASQLVHPNIARVLEAGRIGKTYFIAMELVRGDSLVTLLRRAHKLARPVPIGAAIAIMLQALEALDHAHDRQVVHRDFTPSNLLVTDEGHVVVIDFGVAKALAGQLQTNSGLAKGKIGYMSFEAIGGKNVDARADIFSAGVVLWELLAGRRLFRGHHDGEIIAKIMRGEVPPPSRHHPGCPPALDDIVLRATARDADDRWPTASALRRELAKLRRDHDATPAAIARWVFELSDEETLELADDDLEEVGLARGSRRERFVDADTVVSESDDLDS